MPFIHTSKYIKQKSMQYCDYSLTNRPRQHALMHDVGYRSPEKFVRHRKLWDQMKKDIPLAYLKAIGVSMQELLKLAKQDYVNYLYCLTQELKADQFKVIRGLMAVATEIIPEPYRQEKDAVEYVRQYMKTYDHPHAYLRLGEVKQYNFTNRKENLPEKLDSITLFEPRLEIAKEMLKIHHRINIPMK